MGTADHGAARAVIPRLDPAQIDQPVVREIWVDDDVAEPTLPAIGNLRHAADVEYPPVGPPQLQSPPFLRDEQVARRQEGHRPGLVELADRLDLEGSVLRRGGSAAA